MTFPTDELSVDPLWRRLDRRSTRSDLLLVWEEGDYRDWSWDKWYATSLRCAGDLHRRGVRPGDSVGCLLTNSGMACAAVFGVWFAGASIVSLPLIARGMSFTEYVAMLRRIVQKAELSLIICEATASGALSDADIGARVLGFHRLADGPPRDPVPPADDDPAFVQFSSGSTSEPRGCILTPRAIATQLTALDRALAIDPEADTGVVWLPLSHDMGLFGCLLLTYWTGHRLVLGSPERFLTQPWTWFEDCARFNATVSAAPNFALDIAARVARARPPRPFRMRRMVVGGERVEPATLRRIGAVLGDEELTPLLPAYGLAEAVLAVTMSPLHREPMIVDVDADLLSAGSIEPAVGRQRRRTVSLASSGPPLPGNEVRIRSEAQVGEIQVRTPTLATGYLNDPEETGRRFTSDGLRTGDVGFLLDGELFVIGRTDDLMSVGGRNVYGRDIEQAIADVSAIRAGACAAVDVETGHGTELVVLAELRDHHPDVAVIIEEVRSRALVAVGVNIAECHFLPRGKLPKTPSGKLQRYRCRELATSLVAAAQSPAEA